MVEDDEQEDPGAKVEFLRVQLSCLILTVDGCQRNLCGCNLQEVGIRARNLFLGIKMSLQDMLQSLSGKEGTSQMGSSHSGTSHRAPV